MRLRRSVVLGAWMLVTLNAGLAFGAIAVCFHASPYQ